MSAHLTIALIIAFAMIVNARIVVARSASMLPSEMLKNMESERLPNKMVCLKKNTLILNLKLLTLFFLEFLFISKLSNQLNSYFEAISIDNLCDNFCLCIPRHMMNTNVIWKVGHMLEK